MFWSETTRTLEDLYKKKKGSSKIQFSKTLKGMHLYDYFVCTYLVDFLVLTLKRARLNSVALAFLFFSTDFTGSKPAGLVVPFTSSNMRSEEISSTSWSKIAFLIVGSEGVVSSTPGAVI